MVKRTLRQMEGSKNPTMIRPISDSGRMKTSMDDIKDN
jgi:hypothetical protein